LYKYLKHMVIHFYEEKINQKNCLGSFSQSQKFEKGKKALKVTLLAIYYASLAS